ncbi:protein prenylyltransferase [Ganoderma leucocontextum]|nr:protein prenylyltransferase [Ganoderma leucocontextum]
MTNKKNKQAKKKQQAAKAAANGAANGSAMHDKMDVEKEPIVVQDSGDEDMPDLEPAPVEEDPDKIKEKGNAAFKAGKFQEAIDQYSRAIDLRPSEPTFWTNRAAAYMALKRFKPALSDCQQAAILQSADPQPKTLVRLARCQLSTGSTAPALSTLRSNAAALQLQTRVLELEAHLRNLEGARGRGEWGMARLALVKCIQVIEGEGGDVPIQWRLWRVEIEIGKKNWDAASLAANDAMRFDSNSPDVMTVRGLLLFLASKTAQAMQHRIKDVERLKEEGNVAFKGGRLAEAAQKYGEALDRIGSDDREGGGGHIRAMLLSNRATTLVKLERYEDALADTEASLELNSTSFKALRTRARINLHLEKYDAAIADFNSAIEQAGFENCDADVRALRAELKKAEVALKRSKTKDYYKILGVDRDCSDTDIRKAYRRESLKHHPDKVRICHSPSVSCICSIDGGV